jgi:hypothetical protein
LPNVGLFSKKLSNREIREIRERKKMVKTETLTKLGKTTRWLHELWSANQRNQPEIQFRPLLLNLLSGHIQFMSITRFTFGMCLASFAFVTGCATSKPDSAQLDQLMRRTSALEQRVHDLEDSNAALQKQVRELENRRIYIPGAPPLIPPQSPRVPPRSPPSSNEPPPLTPIESK